MREIPLDDRGIVMDKWLEKNRSMVKEEFEIERIDATFTLVCHWVDHEDHRDLAHALNMCGSDLSIALGLIKGLAECCVQLGINMNLTDLWHILMVRKSRAGREHGD